VSAAPPPPARVWVTAGPTWVPLDAVRHIGNASSGRTGLLLARAFQAAGARVTLLLGPGRCEPTADDRARLRVEPFVTFHDLRSALLRAAAGGTMDVLVHAAAVSDYEPVEARTDKIASDRDELVIRLRRTPKIVDEVRRLAPELILVKFKLEVGRSRAELLTVGEDARAASEAEFLVANDLALLTAERHPALVLGRDGLLAEVETGEELAAVVVRLTLREWAARGSRR
jgi:phosphopantothenoylcysteine synthetase/decarboxylase